MVAERVFTRLSPEQRERFETDGYLLLPSVFDAAEVDRLRDAADRLESKHDGMASSGTEAFERVNIIEDDDTFLDLIDHPVLLGSAMDIMGATVQLLVSTVTMRPTLGSPAIRWHTDDPSPYFFPRLAGTCPVWQLKSCVYLTDVDEPDMGNFVAAPGSHRSGVPYVPEEFRSVLSKENYRDGVDVITAVAGSRQVFARAGDVLIFHPGLWHTVAPNRSSRVRKNLWYVFGPLWMRLGDRLTSSPELIERCDPVRRQLLGSTVGPHRSSLAPQDEGAPLIKLWEQASYNETWRRNLDQLLDQWWSDERPPADATPSVR
jgi:ectoine hydroxylase-related dioxygenase (phytanoyl-CoA dioxygenase family)